ncbi:echinoidin-like isoform X3 [Strongylocentrotus purpuratus]|uniref:C-type lectin domain-containing protein n=1 Tax=Strongylocentrotus purpuratus TaxID=7668 RepID=A0A7M7HND6_STRPU|nr:echinoidin-like isoform X3 [Strongylocentrotus purpuratus]|eukprot:XP_011675436.1 PREDICTED: echinoidin-like [Strongylocentrotus purpuratus]
MFNKIVTILVIASSAVMLPVLPGCQARGCGCPPFWTAFQNNCYRYFSVKNITWHEAEKHCSGFSVPCSDFDSSLGHLTSIHSKEEMTFISVLYESIRDKLAGDPRVWIGLHDQTTEASWEWSDGSSLDYEIWESGQPNSALGGQDCAEFHSSNGNTWNDLACDAHGDSGFVARAYVCKLPQW